MTKKHENEKEKMVSWREAFLLNRRAFMIWYKRHPERFWVSALRELVKAVTPYVGVYLSALLIDELAGAREVQRLTHLALLSLLTALALALINGLLDRIRAYVYSASYDKEDQIYAEKLFQMDFAALDDPHTHDLRTRIYDQRNWRNSGLLETERLVEKGMGAVVRIATAAGMTAGLFTSSIPAAAGKLTALNHPLVTSAFLLALAASVLLSPLCLTRAEEYWFKTRDDMMGTNRQFFFWVGLLKKTERALDVRLYNQQLLGRHYIKTGGRFGRILTFARGPMGALYALAGAVTQGFVGISYLFVCVKAWAGAFGVGAATQYIGAITGLSQGLSALLEAVGSMRESAMYLKNNFAFLDIPNTMYQGSLTTEKRADRQYEVEFRDVSFRYPGAQSDALTHVSVQFKVGQHLAIVGMNGSGKTTFIKLLCRLYDPTQGEILLNGIDVRKYRYDEYMKIFSVVFQDFQLPALPLGENVAASGQYDRERVNECLQKAGFDARLARMEKGLDTCLYHEFEQDGVTVSGGEAQKIAIARALYKDAPFIILDEPTAALDPMAEAEIYARFNDIAGDRTAVYISHRLSSCKFCDEILVFDEGRLIERGSHEALCANKESKYYELWHAQAQYYA